MTNPRVPVDLDDLEMAMMMVDNPSGDEVSAYVCRTTGRVLVDASAFDGENELPDDVLDATRYVPVPGRRELDLGNRLAFDFASRHMTDAHDEVRAIFSRRGAWARFKDLLERRGNLDNWYDYQSAAERTALREWAEENGLELVSERDSTKPPSEPP